MLSKQELLAGDGDGGNAYVGRPAYLPAPAKVQAVVRAANKAGIRIVQARPTPSCARRPRKLTPRPRRREHRPGATRRTSSSSRTSSADPGSDDDLPPRRAPRRGPDFALLRLEQSPRFGRCSANLIHLLLEVDS